MWQALKETYQMDNPQSLANMKTALDQCKMVKGQTLEVYIKNHEQLINQHAAVGKPLSEVDRVVSFLSGLHSAYFSRVSNLVTCSTNRLGPGTVRITCTSLVRVDRL